jgi:hypothetical protein
MMSLSPNVMLPCLRERLNRMMASRFPPRRSRPMRRGAAANEESVWLWKGRAAERPHVSS